MCVLLMGLLGENKYEGAWLCFLRGVECLEAKREIRCGSVLLVLCCFSVLKELLNDMGLKKNNEELGMPYLM